jgi:hypothetical protein
MSDIISTCPDCRRSTGGQCEIHATTFFLRVDSLFPRSEENLSQQNAKLTATLQSIMAWAAANGHDEIVKSIKETLEMK